MMDMEMMLQQALQSRGSGQGTSTATVPQQEGSMGPQGGDVAAQIQEQLMAISEALDTTQDPQEMQELIGAAKQLQEMLIEIEGANVDPSLKHSFRLDNAAAQGHREGGLTQFFPDDTGRRPGAYGRVDGRQEDIPLGPDPRTAIMNQNVSGDLGNEAEMADLFQMQHPGATQEMAQRPGAQHRNTFGSRYSDIPLPSNPRRPF